MEKEERGRRKGGKPLLRMRALSQSEGRVIVETSRGKNIRWGHCNQQMYDADGKGWALEQAEWTRTDLQSTRWEVSMSCISPSSPLNSQCEPFNSLAQETHCFLSIFYLEDKPSSTVRCRCCSLFSHLISLVKHHVLSSTRYHHCAWYFMHNSII